MTILSVYNASAPVDEVKIPMLEISHPEFGSIRTCGDYDDHTVTLETGETVVFTGSALDVSLPKRDTSGRQDLNFAIENVTGIAQDAIDRALDAGGEVIVTFREYFFSDLSAPAKPPTRMLMKQAQMKGSTLQVTCSFQDIIGRAWPRDRYNNRWSPGLRHIAA